MRWPRGAGLLRRDGVYGRRWQWWFPWQVTGWWRPGWFRGGDEWCNPSTGLVVPALGCLVVFAPGPRRVLPTPECWAAMDGAQRADYAPCAVYYGGRVNPQAHDHWDGPCPEALAWLETVVAG